MSLTARLYIEGHKTEKKGIRVLSCDFEFLQKIEQNGFPTSKVEGGKLNIVIDLENDPDILLWMINASADKNGKIVYIGRDNGKALKTIEFKNGRLIRYHEHFTALAEVTVQLTISAQKLNIAGVSHKNMWSGYD
ncbi:MAG: hypothetical protein L3J11_02435 [Draconibacterium sp.]|nr:hypothetical protein [Draconibacterium sp.]